MIIKKELIVNEIHISYYEQGKGKPLLFLHGGRLRAMTFKSTIEALSNNFYVIAPDIPGYGNSSTPRFGWAYQDYAYFFGKFIKQLGLKNVTVIGYSLGGGIAYHLASACDDISQLILVDAAGIEKSKKNPLQRDIDRVFFYLRHPLYISSIITLIREYVLFVYKHILNLYYIGQLRLCLEVSTPLVSTITVPTAIIWAKDDKIFPEGIAEKLHKSIKNSTIQIVEENHDWPIYNNKKFNRILLEKLLFNK